MAAIKTFLILLLFSNNVLAENLAEYNKALIAYEKKIIACKKLKQAKFTDQLNSNIDENAIRTGLSYFILKNDEECSEREKSTLISSINAIQDDHSIANMIRFDSKNVLALFKDSDRMLSEAKQAFITLDNKTKMKLKEIEAYKRPFDPMMAIGHYLKEK